MAGGRAIPIENIKIFAVAPAMSRKSIGPGVTTNTNYKCSLRHGNLPAGLQLPAGFYFVDCNWGLQEQDRRILISRGL